MSKGFVYALINSSIPGAIKVGKTVRTPEERANELSGATGVATDFLVAYYQYSEDCSEAEDYVHAALEIEGYRVSDNREFFSAPLNVVVKAISEAPGIISEDLADKNDDVDDAKSSLALGEDEQNNPWNDVFEQAKAFFNGSGDTLEDGLEALRLFKIAAKLGSKEAFRYIGIIYSFGVGVPINEKKALDYWKEGAQRGYWRCYAEMTTLFIEQKHHENARKCLDKYISGILNDINQVIPRDLLAVAIDFHAMIRSDSHFIESYPIELRRLLEVKDRMQKSMDSVLTIIKAPHDEGMFEHELFIFYKERFRDFSMFLESIT